MRLLCTKAVLLSNVELNVRAYKVDGFGIKESLEIKVRAEGYRVKGPQNMTTLQGGEWVSGWGFLV